MKKLILALVILIAGLVITSDICAQNTYFYEETITQDNTYRMTKLVDSTGTMLWEETSDGVSFFDMLTNAVMYNHSIKDIQPALLPDGIVRTVRLKVFLSAHGNDDVQLLADSLTLDKINRRHFLIGPDQTDTLDVSETGLSDGLIEIELFSGSGGDFKIKKSILTIVYTETIPTDVAEESTQLPADFQLKSNFPNPFNPTTTIRFELSKRADVRIEIFNAIGQLTRVLIDDQLSIGRHEVVWDGRTQTGGIAPTGVYFYRMSTNGQSESKKMLLLK